MQLLIDREYDKIEDGKITAIRLNSYPVGDYKIKLKDDLYSLVHETTNTIVVSDLVLFSAALAIAHQLDTQNYSTIDTILYLESRFDKHWQRSLFYQNSQNWDLFNNERVDALACVRLIHSYIKLKSGK